MMYCIKLYLKENKKIKLKTRLLEMARFLFYACKVPSLLIAFGLFGIDSDN